MKKNKLIHITFTICFLMPIVILIACTQHITTKNVVWKKQGKYDIIKTDTGFYLFNYHLLDILISKDLSIIENITALNDSINRDIIMNNIYKIPLYKVYSEINLYSKKRQKFLGNEHIYFVPTPNTFKYDSVKIVVKTPYWRGTYGKDFLCYTHKGKTVKKKFDIDNFYSLYQLYPISEEHFIIAYSSFNPRLFQYVGIICLSSHCKELFCRGLCPHL